MNKHKILKLLFLFFIFFYFFQFILISPLINNVQAANVEFKPQVGMGEYQKGQSYPVEKSTAMIAKYIRAIYKYAIGIVGILATVVMMLGGIMWLTAGGNQTRIGEAKAWITASISGLVIALCSYLILATVNPALVNLKISPVEEVISKPKDDNSDFIDNGTEGCCELSGLIYRSATRDNCSSDYGGVWHTGGLTKDEKCVENPNSPVKGCCLWRQSNCGSVIDYWSRGAEMTKKQCDNIKMGHYFKEGVTWKIVGIRTCKQGGVGYVNSEYECQ